MLAENPELEDEIRPEIISLQGNLKSLAKEKVDPDDQKNAIVEIQSGVGGDESALFAADLYKMYEAYAKSKKLSLDVIDFTGGNAGGFKHIIFMISGKNAYRYFKNESGGSRVQRVPRTETKGRVHTSIASVIVLPETKFEEVKIDKKDVKVENFSAGGPGGQSVNKNHCAIRLTHKPTGVSVTSRTKSLQANLKYCWKMLASIIADAQHQQQAEKTASKKRALRGSGMRNERIRTYNFPQDRVTDHRIKKNYSLATILAGKLDSLVEDLVENLD